MTALRTSMRNCLLILALLAPAAFAADANAPASDASIEQLLVASKAQMLVESTIANIERSLRQSAASASEGRSMSIEQQNALDASLTKTAKILRDEMSWAALKPIYLQVYRETFTQTEVDGLIAFFRTPVGSAYIDKTPMVAQKTAQLMQQRIGTIMPRLQDALEDAQKAAAKAPQ